MFSTKTEHKKKALTFVILRLASEFLTQNFFLTPYASLLQQQEAQKEHPDTRANSLYKLSNNKTQILHQKLHVSLFA